MLIKICGLTDVKETEYLKENKVDFAGIVMFFEKSKRNTTPDKAKEIIHVLKQGEQDKLADQAKLDTQRKQWNQVEHGEQGKQITKDNHESSKWTISSGIKAVAVMVAPTVEQIHMAEEAGFDYLQIHGNVNEELLDACTKPVLKAFNVDDLDKYDSYLKDDRIVGFVFDAGAPGSGKTFDWNILAGMKRDKNRLYILAGGLNAANVEAAIKTVRPDGVDVSSGVEYTDKPGKDPAKIKEFVREANIDI